MSAPSAIASSGAPDTPAADLIQNLGHTCIALYGTNLSDPDVQIPLAALAQNLMFQRICAYAQRAALTHALASIDAAIARGW